MHEKSCSENKILRVCGNFEISDHRVLKNQGRSSNHRIAIPTSASIPAIP
jgi:tRNA G37 N-methylase TrmD